MEDMEMQLEELHQHPETMQLHMLTHEIEHIHEHGIQPSPSWYEARFLKLYEYSELNWEEWSLSFSIKNPYVAEGATRIHRALDRLIEEWSVHPIFDLSIYYQLLHDMNELWEYYQSEYVDEMGDDDVSDLISGLKHL